MKDKSAQILLLVFLLLALLNAATALASGELACHDFFAAACPQVDVDDEQSESAKIKRQMYDMIYAAQEVGLRQMGLGSVREAFFKFVKENGFTPRTDIPDAKIRKFIDQPDNYGLNLAEYFVELQACEKQKEKLGEKWGERYKISDAAQKAAFLSELERELDNFTAENEALQLRVYTTDPVRLFDEVYSMCSRLKTSIKEKNEKLKAKSQELGAGLSPAPVLLQVPATCFARNLHEARNQAIEAFRVADPKNPATVAFVSAQVRNLREVSALNSAIYSYEGKAKTPAVDQEARLTEAWYTRLGICTDLNTQARGSMAELKRRFFENLSKSRPVVEAILDSVYSAERKEKLNDLVVKSKASVGKLIQDSVLAGERDTPTAKKIREELAALRFFWPEKPKDELYTTVEGYPLPILNHEKIGRSLVGVEIASVFFDPELRFFATVNASYNPMITAGEMKMDEMINIYPGILVPASEKKYAMLTVVAHEVGHKVGFRVSHMNGHDLMPRYEKLASCLKRSDSISMLPFQEDESISDWISGNVLADVIGELPDYERPKAVLESVYEFCVFGEGRTPKSSPQDGHPTPYMRINGIYGADVKLRSFMGCEGSDSSRKFVSCTLEGPKK